MPDLLIELFSEEIPARMQARAADDLRRIVTDGLVAGGLTYAGAAAFATPRRLTLAIEGLEAQSRATVEERKGPNTTAPDAAVQGFLRSTGLTLDQLEKRADKKGEVWFAVMQKPGRPAADIIAEVLADAIRDFPWPKSMRWGAGSLRWVRPLQSILCILTSDAGAEVVPLTVEGFTAGNTTEGHRFMAPGRFAVSGFDDYRAKLRRAFVILDGAERADAIWNDATQAAFAMGLEVVADRGLLAEVAGLVEWPVVLLARIPAQFLHLPPEVLQTSMREHQKFFSLRDPRTGRIEGFVTVANRETADHGVTILKGNLKVLSARLSDARFFWDNDLRVARSGMGEWLDGLGTVTFHNKLGSQADRVARIAALAREIAPLVGADPDQAEDAARIAKADLRSAMVGEFPELQGVMGRYYALEAGRDAAVADAARDHYSPLGPSDDVPTAPVSVAVALADKLDTLAGFWAIDEKPTGSKDPFALRRAALGVIRLVLGNGVRLPLMDQIGFSLAAAGAPRPEPTDPDDYTGLDVDFNLLAFFHDRLKVYLKDQSIRHDVIDACLAMPGNDDLTLLVKRAEALNATLATEDGANLVQGFKRAANILTQAEAKDGVEYSYGADPKFAETDEERALFAALDAADAKIAPAMASEDFAAAMAAMADLRAPVDAFFTAVQVNADNQIVRRNRLNLLSRIRTLCLSVADLTKLDG
jgi:glycyl-tRNA synthetase beta chain